MSFWRKLYRNLKRGILLPGRCLKEGNYERVGFRKFLSTRKAKSEDTMKSRGCRR
jgi:hypothetical protein